MGVMSLDPADAALGVRAIHAACDAGVTTFDTAPLYGFGAAEELLGRAIADRRSRVQVLTKAGLRWDAAHGRVMFEFADGRGARRAVRKDSRPASIREEVEASLRRLGVECIDVLQLHQPDVDTPIEQTAEALAALLRQGKLRAVGASNFSVRQLESLREALHPLPLVCVQDEYNLLERRVEAALLPWARDAGTGVLAYSPLAKGVLAGGRRAPSYLHAADLARANAAIEAVLAPIARARGVAPGQLALAWVLAQPGVVAVVAGARTPEQALSNAGAAALVLDGAEERRLREAFDGFRGVRRGLLARLAGKLRRVLG